MDQLAPFIEERFVRASGPGGQNVNKVATAVELRFNLAASPLPPDVQARLAGLAGRRLTAEGVLVIDARAARSQAENRRAARGRLAALIQRASRAPKKRRPTKPSAGVKERRLVAKHKRAQTKRRRGRADLED